MSEYHKVLRGLVENSDKESALNIMKSREIRKNSLNPLDGYIQRENPKTSEVNKYTIPIVSTFAIIGTLLYIFRK